MPATKFSRSDALNHSASIVFTKAGTPAARAPPVSVVGMINSDTSPMRVHSSALRGVAGVFASRPGKVSDRPNVVASCTKARRSSDFGTCFILNLSSPHSRQILPHQPDTRRGPNALEYRTGVTANQHPPRLCADSPSQKKHPRHSRRSGEVMSLLGLDWACRAYLNAARR